MSGVASSPTSTRTHLSWRLLAAGRTAAQG
jgi:hypothetical protein